MNDNQSNAWLRPKDIVAAYTLLRIIVGVNYFNHGATRMGNIPGFMDAMVQTMQESWIPEVLVRLNAALAGRTSGAGRTSVRPYNLSGSCHLLLTAFDN